MAMIFTINLGEYVHPYFFANPSLGTSSYIKGQGRVYPVHSNEKVYYHGILGGGFKYFFKFTPKIGEDEPILTIIFFNWVGSTTTWYLFRVLVGDSWR